MKHERIDVIEMGFQKGHCQRCGAGPKYMDGHKLYCPACHELRRRWGQPAPVAKERELRWVEADSVSARPIRIPLMDLRQGRDYNGRKHNDGRH